MTEEEEKTDAATGAEQASEAPAGAETADRPAPGADASAAAEPEDGAAAASDASSAETAESEETAAATATAALEAEIAALRDKHLRLQADFDNYRKRQARDRSEWISQANADLLEDLLPALDQTDLALAAAQKDATDAAKPFLDGFALVHRTLLAALAKHGLKPVEDTVGKPLDTATSEAVTVMRTGQAAPGCVVYETRKGYTLNGKVLRAAQVVVEEEAEAAPAPAPAAAAPETDAPAQEAAPGQSAEG